MAFTGCAAGQGMVSDFSVLNRVYNFVRDCLNYKQGIFASTIDLISEMKFVCSPNIYKRYGFKVRQRTFNSVCILGFFVLNRVGVSNPQRITYTQILVEYHPKSENWTAF